MARRRFTIGQLMLAVAAVVVEFGLLPTPLALFAACLTLSMPLIATSFRWGVLGLSALGLPILLMLPAIIGRSHCSRSRECASNLRQVSLALQQYLHVYGCFPPAYVADPQGRPLYSWRALILPYIDEQDLYNSFNFSQPWDGPDNLPISNTPIRVFACPEGDGPPNGTNYLAVVGPETAFPGVGRITEAHLRDGLARTVVLAEVANAKVCWAEPRDLDIRKMSLKVNDHARLGISSSCGNSPVVAFADSSLRRLDESLSPKTLRAMLTINGHENIDLGELGR